MSMPVKQLIHQPISGTELMLVPQPAALEPAGFWIRMVAHGIDTFILSAGFMPIYFMSILLAVAVAGSPLPPGEPLREQTSRSFYVLALIFSSPLIFGLLSAYYGLFQKLKGGTPGKLVLGLRVVHADTGAFIGFWHSVARLFAHMISACLPFGVGHLMIGFRSDKRGLHDLMAGTRVVKN